MYRQYASPQTFPCWDKIIKSKIKIETYVSSKPTHALNDSPSVL